MIIAKRQCEFCGRSIFYRTKANLEDADEINEHLHANCRKTINRRKDKNKRKPKSITT